MEDRKFRVLLSLILLTLLTSTVSLILTLSPGTKTTKPDSGLNSDILQTPAHLSTSERSAGPAIARIKDKKITRQELEEQFQILPPEMMVPFVTREDTLNFLRQYIGLELVYQEAVRQNLGQDPEILARLQDTKKKLMIDKYLSANFARHQYKPSEDQIRQYYQLNKAVFAGQSLEQVRDNIVSALYQQHRRRAYQDLVDQLWQKAKVEIFEDSL